MPTLTGQCVPAGPFPIADSNDIIGGPMQVADSTARLAIHSSRRRIGMKVWQIDTGVEYQLIGGITNSDWVIATGGGALTISDADPTPTTDDPTSSNAVWINRLLGKIFVAKADLSGWIAIIE